MIVFTRKKLKIKVKKTNLLDEVIRIMIKFDSNHKLGNRPG